MAYSAWKAERERESIPDPGERHPQFNSLHRNSNFLRSLDLVYGKRDPHRVVFISAARRALFRVTLIAYNVDHGAGIAVFLRGDSAVVVVRVHDQLVHLHSVAVGQHGRRTRRRALVERQVPLESSGASLGDRRSVAIDD